MPKATCSDLPPEQWPQTAAHALTLAFAQQFQLQVLLFFQALAQLLPGQFEFVDVHEGVLHSSWPMRCLSRLTLVAALASLMPSTSLISRWLRSSR